MNWKKIIGVAIIALLIWWILSSPASAATSISNLGSDLKHAADSVISFFNRLV